MATFSMVEQASGTYRATITDEGGNILPASSLTTLTLSLYVIGAGGTLTYIRQDQNALNLNGVAVYDSVQTDVLVDDSEVDYSLKWTITPTDTTLVNSALTAERHIALFEWTWGSGKAGKHEVILVVKNLTGV